MAPEPLKGLTAVTEQYVKVGLWGVEGVTLVLSGLRWVWESFSLEMEL